ncbi:LysR family transcriptional regulator [Ectopseudomonas mendocina]|jgi:LysR family glycine cleavage system transcriptional activator|uniref:HTH-type transcriptional regulator TrpI n=2 Tax=Ectopseudomonas mendocina TaxID=300 RepID=A0A379IYD8_ECTME|nr:transcriptional regulator GcvA [Pseudomonas mendocina]MBL0949243.1 transcriptional regulator GcvA [Pseudomonas sp.]AEB57736.1 transcriptional regulator, LysR family [Pseudomonas mendocina NK-01]ALN19933.1 LysR family transcriptional regulator [Pseudomonas mendocina S5.2]KER99175.1 LysR family transcriptional regulator [Pseudomonas mendocina]MDF2073988.1 transcriptional regulator GcvA [Pseudomonas mendocina]
MQNRVSLKAIQAFEAAARLSSFALAAEELFVTPSAVSHQIKLLEEQFGVRLFHRVHRAVVLTDAGRVYAEEVSAAFARIDIATRELGRTAKSDILTVHSTPSFATQWLMPRLARFSALEPDIDVRLNASYPAPADLLTQGVDIDIRYGMKRLQPAGTMVLPFPAETIVPLCAPSLANGAHAIRAPEDLRHHTLIHSEVCLISWRDWMRQHRKVPLDISRGPRFDRSFMAISAAVDGQGICLESLLLVQRELDSGRLVAPLGMTGPKVQGYTFNLLRSRAELPKIRSFQDWLFSELEGRPQPNRHA